MSHSDTVRELIAVLNPQNEARPTILLGAGPSFSSGVPLADESVKRIARRYYAERVVGSAVRPSRSKHPSGWRGSPANPGSFATRPGSARIFFLPFSICSSRKPGIDDVYCREIGGTRVMDKSHGWQAWEDIFAIKQAIEASGYKTRKDIEGVIKCGSRI